jgi:hypothetical protein
LTDIVNAVWKGSVASLCRIHFRTNINLNLYRSRTKRTYLFWKAHKLKSQGVKHFKKSVFLAKGLERGYKPHYSQYKVILTWFRPLPRQKLWKVGLIGLTCHFFSFNRKFHSIFLSPWTGAMLIRVTSRTTVFMNIFHSLSNFVKHNFYKWVECYGARLIECLTK